MRDRFPLLLVAGLVFIGVVGSFLVTGARRGAFADRLSTYRSEPDGARALYLMLEAQHRPVTRLQKSFEAIDHELAIVMLGVRFDDESSTTKHPFDGSDAGLDPDEKANDDEDFEDFKARGFSSLKATNVDADEREKLLEQVRNGATLVYAPWGWRDNPLLTTIGVSLVRADKKLELRTLVAAQPSRFTTGVEHVETQVQSFLSLPVGAVPLLVDDALEQPVVALVPWGQGRVIVIGAPELAQNQRLAIADNARFWSSLLEEVGQAHPLAFDEFHHGFTGERSMGEFAARYGLQYAVGQLLLGVALWALALRRFGRQRDPVKELRVGATDALAATSRIYREGHHHPHAADAIARALAAELAVKAGVSGRSTPTEIAAALEVRGRKDLARALLDVTTAARSASTDAELQNVARLSALARRHLHLHARTPTL